MAQLAAQIVTVDESFRHQLINLLRSGRVPVGVIEDRVAALEPTSPDLALVDIRTDCAAGLAAIERLRARSSGLAIFAMAGATDPALIVADEPTGNLDSRAAENVLALFADLARRGKTVLIVTHDPSITRQTDQTIMLADGEIVDQFVARPAEPVLAFA